MTTLEDKIRAHVDWRPEHEGWRWAGGPIVECGFRLSFCGFHYARVWKNYDRYQATGYLGEHAYRSLVEAQADLTDLLVRYLEAVDRNVDQYVDSCIRDYAEGKIGDGWNTRGRATPTTKSELQR